MKAPAWWWLCVCAGLAFWGVALYVIAHFVGKYW